ncbi:MAG: methionyl-tRNA formyltransferase, partial [Chloroflexota bacterium]|nr:methionyl-tRNA formyltransferase [Chloroflexota bacterium]
MIVSEKSWNKDMHLSLAKEIDANFILISNRDDFTLDRIKEIDPDRIFFPHWSYIIPSEIFENFNCI